MIILLIAGSLVSANSSILAPCDLFKEVVVKNQDFMLIRLLNAIDLIGCGGDNKPIRTVLGSINQSHSY